MSKPGKSTFVCQQCGTQYPKWNGNCTHCNAWNSIIEEKINPIAQRTGYAGQQSITHPILLADVAISEVSRYLTGSAELDRVLGGGIVTGSVVLVGGDPGIGKSTLLLQTLVQLQQQALRVLYVTGEESLQQIKLRAQRLNLAAPELILLADTRIESILNCLEEQRPHVVVIDSIQTMCCDTLTSAAGSVGQVRESAAALVRFAKQSNTAIFLVGHVTKEGALAGPRVLEHMVDCVLYFEGQNDQRYRLIRAAKNRFGAINEIGIFAMNERGLRDITNPSALFLSRPTAKVAGSAIVATWEGSRALLVEVQALLAPTYLDHPRRVAVGFEQNRLAMLLAILHRHADLATFNQDIFVNVVGGLRVNETAIDLAILFAIASSIKSKPIPADWVIFGEMGLSGEIRPVQYGQERIQAAQKQGFETVILPPGNRPQQNIAGINLLAANEIGKALEWLH